MDFRPLDEKERNLLYQALRGNVEEGKSLVMSQKDTSFLGSSDEVDEQRAINAIRSIPCHY